MPKVGRQGPRIDALIDQLEAGGMAQQVRMDPSHPNALGRPCQRLEKSIRGERRARFGVRTKRRLPPPAPGAASEAPRSRPASPGRLAFTVLSGDLVLTF